MYIIYITRIYLYIYILHLFYISTKFYTSSCYKLMSLCCRHLGNDAVVIGGGFSDEIGYVEIASLGNTTQFGKFTVQTTANQDPACFSNGHGGLG